MSNPAENNESSSDNNSGGAPADNATTDTAAVRPNDEPAAASAGANANGNETSQSRERALGEEVVAEKKPELSFEQKMADARKLVADFNLRPEIVAEYLHGIAGKVMAGVNITKDMAESVVQKIDPLEFAAKKLRDVVASVAPASHAEGFSVPQIAAAPPQRTQSGLVMGA